MTPQDRHFIEEWTARQIITRNEYARCPDTTRVNKPCIRDCGRVTPGNRGVCRDCTRSAKGMVK